MDHDVRRLESFLRASHLVVVAVASTFPKELPADMTFRQEWQDDLQPFESVRHAHSVVVQKMEDLQSAITTLGTMHALRRLLQYLIVNPNQIRRMLPYISETMSKMEESLTKLLDDSNSCQTSAQIWAEITSEMKPKHEEIAYTVVRDSLDVIMRKTFKDMSTHVQQTTVA
jgi:hypothetical protein